MASVTIGTAGLDMTQLDIGTLLFGSVTLQNSHTYVLNNYGEVSTFTGVGFTYDTFGHPTGGIVTGLQETYNGQLEYQISGMNSSVSSWVNWANNDDTLGAMKEVFGGADTLQGSLGADTLGGFAGNDSISGGAGNDFINGGPSIDGVSAGNDTISGGAGDDTIGSVNGTTYLRGDDGNDVIQGGSGFDDINGNKGDDTIDGGSGGGDWLVGGQGADLITAHAGGGLLYGNMGNDTLVGSNGADVILGGQGDDLITGGGGNDYISGDRGNDTETGGAGADTFHGIQAMGIDKVMDFHLAEGDRVMLDPGMSYTVSQVGADTVIDVGGGNEMILVGVQMSTLTPGWIFEG
jgi:Ca2+-binding RTX toxin-like protein